MAFTKKKIKMELKNLHSYNNFITEKRNFDELNEANIFTKMITGMQNMIRKSKIGKQVDAYRTAVMPIIEDKYRKGLEKDLLLSQKTPDKAQIATIDKEITLIEQKQDAQKKKFEAQVGAIAKKDAESCIVCRFS